MNNIKKLRIMRKMTQQDLANEIQVERTSVSKYEKYDVLPSKEVLFHLADFFNVSLDFLLGRNTSTNEHTLTPEERKLLSLFAGAVPQGQKAALMVLELGQSPLPKTEEEKAAQKQEAFDGRQGATGLDSGNGQSDGSKSDLK